MQRYLLLYELLLFSLYSCLPINASQYNGHMLSFLLWISRIRINPMPPGCVRPPWIQQRWINSDLSITRYRMLLNNYTPSIWPTTAVQLTSRIINALDRSLIRDLSLFTRVRTMCRRFARSFRWEDLFFFPTSFSSTFWIFIYFSQSQ